MRIAYVCADRGIPVTGNSGSSVHVCELVKALTARGHDVTVFAADPGPTAIRCEPVSIIDLGDDPVLEELRARIAKSLRERSQPTTPAFELYNLWLNDIVSQELERTGPYDFVYERHSLWSFAGLRYARRKRIPFLLEVNAPLLEQQQRYRNLAQTEAAAAIERLLLSHADRVLVTTESLSAYAHEAGCTRRKLRVVPCGAPTTESVPVAERPGSDGNEFVIGFLGSLKPWHGIDTLLEAFRKLHAENEAYRLLIVGEGPMRVDIDAFRTSSGLGDHIEVVGAVAHQNVPAQLARMHVGTAPYPAMDPFYFSPLKVWEYAAAGVPIAAAAIGDLPRLWPHKQAAMLHPPGRSAKLAKHIRVLRERPSMAARLAREARRTAHHYSWDRLAARVESLAANVVSEGVGRKA